MRISFYFSYNVRSEICRYLYFSLHTHNILTLFDMQIFVYVSHGLKQCLTEELILNMEGKWYTFLE